MPILDRIQYKDGYYFLPADNNKSVQVRLFLSPSIFPNEECLQRLKFLSEIPGVSDPVFALPDVYVKEKNFIPTGIGIGFSQGFSPNLVTPPNDGFSLAWTGLNIDEISDVQFDSIFEEVKKNVAVFRRQKPALSENELWSVLRKGITEMGIKWGFSKEDLLRADYSGNAFGDEDVSEQEIKDVFPKSRPEGLPEFVPEWDLVKAGVRSMGVIDGGSHFAELSVVEEVISEELAHKSGLKKGQVLLAIHNGPADVGILAHKLYQPSSMENIEFLNQDSVRGRNFWTAYRAGANFAFANRYYIMAQFKNVIAKLFPKRDGFRVFSDVPHDYLEQKEWNSEHIFLHRKGCSTALPAKNYPTTSPFCETGRPFYFPAALAQDSYIVTNQKGNENSGYLCSHGTGRAMKIDEAWETFNEADVLEEVSANNVRLYRYGKTNFSGQAPGAYKKMGDVFSILTSLNLVEPVARLKPVATLKA